MTTEMTTTEPTAALARVDPPRAAVLAEHGEVAMRLRYEPANWTEAMKVAQALYRSGLLPSAIRTPEAAIALIVYGAERGLTVMQSLTGIYVVEGRPSMSAEMMVALCVSAPVCEWLRLVESTADRAVYETQRRGHPSPTRYEYTAEDASAAGLLGRGTWKAHRRAMLRARAASGLCRIVYPDVVGGIYTPDETDDLRGATTTTAEAVSVAGSTPTTSAPDTVRSSILAAAAQVTSAPAVLAEARAVEGASLADAARETDALDAAEDARVSRLQAAAPKAPSMSERVEALRQRYADVTRRGDETAEQARARAASELGRVTEKTFGAWAAAAELAIGRAVADSAEREPGADG